MSARAWVAFAAVSTLWGMPYLFIKIAVDDGVPPAFLAWVRVVLGGAVLLGLAWHAGALGSLRGRWRWIAVFAVVEICLPFPLIAAGEQHVSSSLAAIIIAAAPLFVALLALRFDAEERATGARLAGLLLGLAGVIALMGIDVAGRADELVGALMILFSAFCYAVGPMVLKRQFADLDPRASMGAALAVAAVVLLPAVAVQPPTAMPSGSRWWHWGCSACSARRRRSSSTARSWPRRALDAHWSSPTSRRWWPWRSASRCWASGRARAPWQACC
jgi:drug/metabolite transporter (DMT)-like permease